MHDPFVEELTQAGLLQFTRTAEDLNHLLSAERAARGSFYATRVGFVAVNTKGLRLARTHNGFPIGVEETSERWSRAQKDFYHLHAESAGVFHALRFGYSCQGATAYITHPSCPGCTQVLIAAGFSKIVFARQSLVERKDWHEDIVVALRLAKTHGLGVFLYEDEEQSLPHSDITRTEVTLKKIYDALVPQARFSSLAGNTISKPAKPESPEWVEQPVVRSLLAAARDGVHMQGLGIVMDYPPECRAATALIQAGISNIIIRDQSPDRHDPRWAVPLELARAEEMIRQDAKIEVYYGKEDTCNFPLQAKVPAWLDATRKGFIMRADKKISLIRPLPA